LPSSIYILISEQQSSGSYREVGERGGREVGERGGGRLIYEVSAISLL